MKETISKINKSKNWFMEKINRIEKPLSRRIKKKKKKKKKREREREKTQMIKIRNE